MITAHAGPRVGVSTEPGLQVRFSPILLTISPLLFPVLSRFLNTDRWIMLGKAPLDVAAKVASPAIKQHLFCKSRISEVGHLASMFR